MWLGMRRYKQSSDSGGAIENHGEELETARCFIFRASPAQLHDWPLIPEWLANKVASQAAESYYLQQRQGDACSRPPCSHSVTYRRQSVLATPGLAACSRRWSGLGSSPTGYRSGTSNQASTSRKRARAAWQVGGCSGLTTTSRTASSLHPRRQL
jgi:hypothetical protein